MRTIKKIQVRNMISPSWKGGEVPNQFIITTDEGTYFQSYNSIIVANIKGRVYLDMEMWDYSVTTGKYRNSFLGETRKETERKIRLGEYKLTALN